MNLTPLFSRIHRKATRSDKDLLELAVKRWILCPAQSHIAPPAVYLVGDLDKVSSLFEDTTRELETARLKGGLKEHGATVAYALKDVELLDGSLYKDFRRYRLLRQRERLVGPSLTESIPQAALACTLYGSFYFAHWLADDLTLHLAVEEFGTPIQAARKSYHDEPDYERLLRIQARKVSRVKLENLVMLDDKGQNSFKRERYQTLRSRLRQATGSNRNSRVFLRRGSAGTARSLVNAVEVESYLQSQGFVVVDPDLLSPGEIARLTSGAKIVVGVEGSHLIHGLLNMADGGTMFVLQPPYRFNNLFKDYTDCLEMQYALLTGIAKDGGFTIQIDELKQLLEKVDATAAV